MQNQLVIALVLIVMAVGGLIGWSVWLYGKGYNTGYLKRGVDDEKIYKERIDDFVAKYNSGDTGYELCDGSKVRTGEASVAGRVDTAAGRCDDTEGPGDTVPVYDKG